MTQTKALGGAAIGGLIMVTGIAFTSFATIANVVWNFLFFPIATCLVLLASFKEMNALGLRAQIIWSMLPILVGDLFRSCMYFSRTGVHALNEESTATIEIALLISQSVCVLVVASLAGKFRWMSRVG